MVARAARAVPRCSLAESDRAPPLVGSAGPKPGQLGGPRRVSLFRAIHMTTAVRATRRLNVRPSLFWVLCGTCLVTLATIVFVEPSKPLPSGPVSEATTAVPRNASRTRLLARSDSGSPPVDKHPPFRRDPFAEAASPHTTLGKEPPPPAQPAPAPEPKLLELPPVPVFAHRLQGVMLDPSGQRQIFITDGDAIVVAQPERQLSSGYVVDSLTNDALLFRHPRLDVPVRMSLPKSGVSSP